MREEQGRIGGEEPEGCEGKLRFKLKVDCLFIFLLSNQNHSLNTDLQTHKNRHTMFWVDLSSKN